MENKIETNDVEIQEQVKAESTSETVENVDVTTPKRKFPIWIIPVAVAIVIGLAMAIVFPLVFGGSDDPVYLDYTVIVVDGAGKPMSNVMVKFTTPDGETKTRVTEKDGIASLKNVIEGEYKVNVEAGLSDAIVLVSEYTLTKENNTVYAVVRDSKNSIEIYGAVEDGAYASAIEVGAHVIPCTAEEMTYYLFYARTPGVYKVSLTSTDERMTVGYYGIPMFVQDNHRGESAYNGKSFELIIHDITTPYIFGINATVDAIANLSIERTGDAPFDPNYAEWIEVSANGPFTACDTTGKTLVDVDISADSFDIVLGSDGYYYTADGKAVYIRLTTAPGHSYTDEEFNTQLVFGGSLALMAGLVEGQDVGNNIGGYVYDENGNFVNKYRYNQMLATYLEYVDGSYGVVQLNAELVECIKLHGQSSGWFNPDSYGYLFANIDVNDEISWLFLCMVEA